MPRVLTRATPPLERPFEVNRDSLQARGLVGWWPTVGATDGILPGYMGPRVPLITTGSPSVVGDSGVGRLLLLNGTTQYASAPAGVIPVFQQTTPFSVCHWVRSTDTDGPLIGNWNVGVSPGWRTDLDTGSFRLLIMNADFSAGRAARTTATSYGDGALYHVVVTFSGNSLVSGITIYINGISVALTTLADTSPGTLVDYAFSAGLSSTSFLSGSVGDLRIYNRSLSPQEVFQMYAAQTRWELYRPTKWRTIVRGPPPATSGAARLAGFGRLAASGTKGATNTAAVRSTARLAPVVRKGGVATTLIAATGRQATTVIKGGLATLSQRAAGLLAAAGAHAGTGAGAVRASGLLGASGAHGGTGTGAVRSVGLLGASGAHAGIASAAVRSVGLLAALGATARSTASALRAAGLASGAGAKASSAGAGERTAGRWATLGSTARSAAALLAALASQAASSVPTFVQAATMAGRARMAASGVKGALSTAAQLGNATLAASGLKAAISQGRLSSSPRSAADARRAAFAAAVLRSQPSLSVVGVVGRSGSSALYVRSRGSVASIVIAAAKATPVNRLFTVALDTDRGQAGGTPTNRDATDGDSTDRSY